MSPREVVAAAHREANDLSRSLADGPFEAWVATDTTKLIEALERANAVENSWRRETGETGCLWGKKGCPPWGMNCQACVGVLT